MGTAVWAWAQAPRHDSSHDEHLTPSCPRPLLRRAHAAPPLLVRPRCGAHAGSPLLATVKSRLAGIRKEYEALDTVWFMVGGGARRGGAGGTN